MKWVYRKTEPGLWTTGFFEPDGLWHTDNDYEDKEEAAIRCAWLNGHTTIEMEFKEQED